jgi:hypothetical protein
MRLSIIAATLLATIAVAMPDPVPQGYTGPAQKTTAAPQGRSAGAVICV